MKNKRENNNVINNILYLNPVASYKYNESFARSLTAYKMPNTAFDVACLQPTADLPEVLDELGYRAYESLIINPTTQVARLGSLATVTKRYDAMVIGCFYDPALFESRTISGKMHVVGPCQASCQMASSLANKFSIIIGMDYWENQMRNSIYEYGYKDYLISFESINISASQIPVDPTKTLRAIQTAAVNAVKKGAEAIILGCTLEMGTFIKVQEYLLSIFNCYIPVIDPSIAAFKKAEYLANSTKNYNLWTMSRIHGMRSPSEADLAKYDVFQTEYKLAHIVPVPAMADLTAVAM